MQKPSPLLFVIPIIVVLAIAGNSKNFNLLNNTLNTETSFNGHKFSSCTISIKFDNDNTEYKKIINNGPAFITVIVSKAMPLIISANKLFYVTGTPTCKIYDENANLIGTIKITIRVSALGYNSKEDIITEYKNIISEKIINEITI